MSTFQFECTELNLQIPTEYFGKFVFKPLEIGQGITIGNILRRVLLNDLQGISIVGVRINRINNEFALVPGLREDVLEILLNLKEVIFKGEEKTKSIGRLKVLGPAIITASSFVLPTDITIINPNQYIATVSDNSLFEMEIILDWGKGYTLAENKPMVKEIIEPLDLIAIDAIFMPVKQVVYHIENTFSELSGAEEQLILEIWTNGSITPAEAIASATRMIIDWFNKIENFDITTVYEKPSSVEENDINSIKIEELNLSSRAYNSLKRANIHVIGDLLVYSLASLKKLKNFGQKSLDEVNQILERRYGVKIE